jgi:hypothetical protein
MVHASSGFIGIVPQADKARAGRLFNGANIDAPERCRKAAVCRNRRSLNRQHRCHRQARSSPRAEVAINRFVAETNDDPKPFTWTADPKKNHRSCPARAPSVGSDPLV